VKAHDSRITASAFLAVVLVLVSSTPDASAQEREAPLRLSRELVTLTVTVMDRQGRFVTGLDPHRFEVFDDKVKQEISFFNTEDAPVTIGVVFDLSGSMKHRVQRSIHALKRFVEASHREDEYFLLGFNNRVTLVRDFTLSADHLSSSLSLASTDGRTALYDAVYLGVEKARLGRHDKRALLLISDGQDNCSRYTFSELRDLVREADVQLYAIGITDPAREQELGPYGAALLEEIARSTGGRAFFPMSEEELMNVCAQIALELRHQYSIGYYPTTDVRDGRWHRVRVKVKAPEGLPDLVLRTRDGYMGLTR
jgi:Ca-activated chloride channel family protein